jgi:tetratricopeptide (TPR) repeat protein
MFRRALEIDEASFGLNNPAVARDLNNLASLLRATNRDSQAEPLIRRALAIDESIFWPDHPNVSTHLGNLADLLIATNRPVEAEDAIRRALVIDEASPLPDHIRTASHLNTLAQILQKTDRSNEAETLMRRHLEAFLNFTRHAQYEHRHLRPAVMNYAKLLQALGLPTTEILAKLTSLGPEPPAILLEEMDRSRK